MKTRRTRRTASPQRQSLPLLALVTDFGTRDWYVASLKAVILSRVPHARFVDITHDVPPQDIVSGAFTLAATVPWFPDGTVFLGVVDPGVGSSRALLAARADAHYFVGPDNGLLSLCLERARQVTVVRLTNRRYWLAKVSDTFQGRDVMAPVAAYLAGGGSLSSLGVPIRRVTPLALPRPQQRGRTVQGHVVHIDAFGNLITDLPAALVSIGRSAARATLRYQQRPIRVVSSYAAGRAKELIAVVGSLGLVELAVRDGSAAWSFNAKRGDPVDVISA